ncbi:MAG: sugar phosphate isomerase/epimerase [Oscillospiraceae bacterium]|nr:sugar phosphate isomerase/epimerase [Oscillospiraceae bacterium]
MDRILCSTGAFIGRANGRDHRLLTGIADKLDCDGFELLMYDDWYECPEDVARTINAIGKPFPAFHVEKDVGERISRNEPGDTEAALDLFRRNCEIASAIHAEKLVLHLWSGVSSDRDMPHNIEVYASLRDIADSYGLMLTVENVVCNCADPMTHLRELAAVYPDIRFTFDTKMAEFHGQLPKIYVVGNRCIWERVAHLHINDYKGGVKDWGSLKTLHIGDGQIRFDEFFEFVRGMGYHGDMTIESTSFDRTGRIDVDSMNRSIERVRGYVRG